jgi:hypothetical protein
VGTITPEEGRSFVDQAVTFITTYSDPGGWQDIHHAELAIGLANGKYVYAYYEQNSNKLYLRDNSSAGNLIGGYLPGTNNTIDHPYAVLNCAGSKAEGQSNTLTISWNLAFKAAFFDLTANTETKNTFLLVYDDANAHQGWLKKGTWTIEKAQSDATPYGLTATVRSSTQIDLAWQHNYVNGTSYVLERDSSPNFNTADFRSSNIGINKQHSDSGLSPNTTYYYRVLASYQGELSDPSNVANATTYPNAPQAPTNLTASEITPLGAKLSWTNPANNNQTGFKISIYENGAWKDHSEAQQTTTIINALNTASDYKFRVRAYNAGGDSANSNEAEVLTIPAARTGFSAQVENIKAKLTWLNPDQHPSTSIEIWRQITALDQDYLKLTQVSSQTTNWLDEGEELTCGGTVKYKLIATNPSGSSDAALAEVTFSFNNSAPYVGDLLPNSGALTSNQFMVLKAYYYDPDGYNNLRKCYLVANKQISDSGGLSAYYDRGTQKTIYLYSDNGQTTQNGLLGTNTILSNSYVEIDCAKTKVYFFGNRIRVEWYVKFKPAFFTNNPSPKGWLKAKDKGGLACDWQQKASW